MKTIMKKETLNMQTKVDRFENATIWKRNDLKGALVGGKFAIRTSSII